MKRSGQARLLHVFDINRNNPTTWRWVRGDLLCGHWCWTWQITLKGYPCLLVTALHVFLWRAMPGGSQVEAAVQWVQYVQRSAAHVGARCQHRVRSSRFIHNHFLRVASRCIGAAMFYLTWMSSAALYWVVSRFLARPVERKCDSYNRTTRSDRCSRGNCIFKVVSSLTF